MKALRQKSAAAAAAAQHSQHAKAAVEAATAALQPTKSLTAYMKQMQHEVAQLRKEAQQAER